jgi:hypothetical protein
LGSPGAGRRAELDLRLDDDGLIRRLTVSVAGSRRTLAYQNLGSPQVIPAPR